jgi:hypothetical protein
MPDGQFVTVIRHGIDPGASLQLARNRAASGLFLACPHPGANHDKAGEKSGARLRRANILMHRPRIQRSHGTEALRLRGLAASPTLADLPSRLALHSARTKKGRRLAGPARGDALYLALFLYVCLDVPRSRA